MFKIAEVAKKVSKGAKVIRVPRVARKGFQVPSSVTVTKNENVLHFKGPKGTSEFKLKRGIDAIIDGNNIMVVPQEGACETDVNLKAMLGTSRVLLENAVIGVEKGFEIKLVLKGVGYRAKSQGAILELTLGFSVPIKYNARKGIVIETPSNTEIIIKGVDKQVVGQSAADIRAFKPPEVYKGKGVLYAGEVIELKQTKKKK